MKRRRLRELEVSAIGLGCMGMSEFYGSAADRDENQGIATIHRALELGVDFLDTADMYGPYTNEMLVGKAIAGRRDSVVLATKFGFERLPDGSQTINGSPAHVHRACDASLQRLRTDRIDLYYQHRVDPRRGVTPAQLALAWLLHRGDDIVPIPGTKKPSRVEENAAAADIELSPDEIAQLDATVPRDAVKGQRHWDMTAVNG